MHNIQYRDHTVNISFNREAFQWQASGDINTMLNAESDDQAIMVVKSIINSKLNGLNPRLQAFLKTL